MLENPIKICKSLVRLMKDRQRTNSTFEEWRQYKSHKHWKLHSVFARKLRCYPKCLHPVTGFVCWLLFQSSRSAHTDTSRAGHPSRWVPTSNTVDMGCIRSPQLWPSQIWAVSESWEMNQQMEILKVNKYIYFKLGGNTEDTEQIKILRNNKFGAFTTQS